MRQHLHKDPGDCSKREKHSEKASEELHATFSALLQLPAGVKALEAGKCCPFWKAWPKTSEGPLEGVTPFEALWKGNYLLKLCQKG